MAQIFAQPFFSATYQGFPAAGAVLSFYLTTTTTPSPVYADVSLETPLGVTVTADGLGKFPPIYLDETVTYRVRLANALGVLMADVDPINIIGIPAGAITADSFPTATSALLAISQRLIILQGGSSQPYPLNDREILELYLDDFLTAQQRTDVRAGTATADLTSAVGAAASYLGTYGVIRLARGRYNFNANMGTIGKRISFKGSGPASTIVRNATATGAAITLGGDTTWDYIDIEDVAFEALSDLQGSAIRFGPAAYTAGVESIGRARIRNCRFDGFDKHIERPYGNIGVELVDNEYRRANFHVWSKDAKPDTTMHAGNLIMQGGHAQSAQKAHVYINSSDAGSGQFVSRDLITEFNAGFVWFFRAFNSVGAVPSAIIENAWDEANYTAGTVQIDGINYAPKQIYAEATPLILMNNCPLGKVQLVGSTLLTDGCDLTNAVLADDASAALIHNNAKADSVTNLVAPGLARSVIAQDRDAGNFASAFRLNHRVQESQAFKAAILQSNNCTSPITFTGSASINSSTVSGDGTFRSACQEVTFAAGQTEFPSTFAVPTGSYVVWMLAYRITSGPGVGFQLSDGATVATAGNLTSSTWQTIGGMARTTASGGFPSTAAFRFTALTGGSTTLRLAGFACLAFANKKDALECLNSAAFPIT